MAKPVKVHVELDADGGIVLMDGEPQPNVSGFHLTLDGPTGVQAIAVERVLLFDEDIYTSAKDFTITKATITIECQEIQEVQ